MGASGRWATDQHGGCGGLVSHPPPGWVGLVSGWVGHGGSLVGLGWGRPGIGWRWRWVGGGGWELVIDRVLVLSRYSVGVLRGLLSRFHNCNGMVAESV